MIFAHLDSAIDPCELEKLRFGLLDGARDVAEKWSSLVRHG